MTLLGILGRRAFTVFFLVTMLAVGVLAAVNIASRYALKNYVADQLTRMAWDISAYQSTDVAAAAQVSAALGQTDGILAANELLFLRNSLTSEDVAYIDGKPIRLPWLSLLTTAEASILPASIRPSGDKAVFVLVGTKAQMGNAYADLQGKAHFEIRIEDHHHAAGDHDGHADSPRSIAVFDVGLERTIRIERNDLNRWFLEQAGSPALIPEVGAILVTPYDPAIVSAFDALARGIVTVHHDDGDIHEEAGNYFPDIIHLLKVDTARLISGWDIAGSLARLSELKSRLEKNTFAIGPRVFIDNSIGVLLERMQATARRVGLISILIAIPLLWVTWILMASLSRMLLLNERRKFGLMRLRGASGTAMGRALLLAIAGGALAGGVIGGLVGTVLPLAIYEGSMLPLETLFLVQPPQLLAVFLGIGVGVALLVSRQFIRRVSSISPLEASGRVAVTDLADKRVAFGALEAVALLLGAYKVIAWAFGFSLANHTTAGALLDADRLLDFLGFPLFIYGFVVLCISRSRLMTRALGTIMTLIGGPMKKFIAQHLSTRPRRVADFLIITAMMTTIGIYPTVITAVFEEKIARGTAIQVGTDLQVTLNAPDIVSNDLLVDGGIAAQTAALSAQVPQLVAALETVPGVAQAQWTLIEGVTDGVYVPGYGFNGLPVYFIPDPIAYIETVRHEPSLGEPEPFARVIGRLPRGSVLMSPAVATFTGKQVGESMQIGQRAAGQGLLDAHVGGSVKYLPGSPLASVTDREAFDTARIDYVNHLFANDAYLVADPGVEKFGDLDVLINSVQIGIRLEAGRPADSVIPELLQALPVEPAAIRSVDEELRKVGSDMYVFLARENVRVYLLGGLILAAIGILSIAYTNYVEDRRTLSLLRIRGSGRVAAFRFFGAGIFAPSLIGLVLGIFTALVVGYGMTNVVWELRSVRNILSYLPTHLVISELTIAIAFVLLVLIAALAVGVSQWAFRRTVREGLREA